MAVATQAPRWSRGRRFAVEPLEDRSLLSGFAIPSQPDAEAATPPADQLSSDSIQVVEISPADEDGDDGDIAREVPVDQLPRPVVAAMNARFPGARLVAAEIDSEDGSLVFDVSAEWGGAELDVALSPDGEVMEVGQVLESADLPQPVRDWISRNYPDSLIQEAEQVAADGSVSYELTIETPGEPAIEAVLRVPGAAGVQLLPDARSDSPFFGFGFLDDSTARRFDNAVPGSDALNPAGNQPATVDSATIDATALLPASIASDAGPHATQRGAEESQRESDHEPGAGSITDSGRVTAHAEHFGADRVRGAILQPFALTESLRPIASAIASAVPMMWLPQVANVLVDVFPLDTTALERSLRQFLDEIDSLTDGAASVGVARQLTPKLLIAAATLAGAERLITQMNKTRCDPVLTSAGGKSTWTWVLNLSDTE